jgi:hypothetical protein
MTTDHGQIPALQQLLKSAHQAVMAAVDGIEEPEIRLLPRKDRPPMNGRWPN